MIILWYQILTIFAVTIGYAPGRHHQAMKPSDWRVINLLAENHPYVVALLNLSKKYICTGTIISNHAVLTTGNCIKKNPEYIAVALAVIGRDININNLHRVAFTKLHSDYNFELNPLPNATQIHSNIGLVFAAQPVLKFAVENADVGDYYATELREKKITAVGYGYHKGLNVTVLQKQAYHQSPCTYPKWYYCICGFEYSVNPRTYEEEFGEGAPVLYDSEVVAITVTSCGRLAMPETDIKYNIFTVLGPYTAWVEKTRSLSIQKQPSIHALYSRAHIQRKILQTYIYIFLFLFSKLLI